MHICLSCAVALGGSAGRGSAGAPGRRGAEAELVHDGDVEAQALADAVRLQQVSDAAGPDRQHCAARDFAQRGTLRHIRHRKDAQAAARRLHLNQRFVPGDARALEPGAQTRQLR